MTKNAYTIHGMTAILLLALLPNSGCVSYKRFCLQDTHATLTIQDKTTGKPLEECRGFQFASLSFRDLTWPMAERGFLVLRYRAIASKQEHLRIPEASYRFILYNFFFFARIPQLQSNRYQVVIYKSGYELTTWYPGMPHEILLMPLRKEQQYERQEEALWDLANALLPGLELYASDDGFRFSYDEGKGRKHWKNRGFTERRQIKEILAFIICEYKDLLGSLEAGPSDLRQRVTSRIARFEYLKDL